MNLKPRFSEFELRTEPPADWDATVDHPFLLSAWADASRTLNLTPYYAWDRDGQVLVQLRGASVLGGRLGRAYLYPSRTAQALVDHLLDGLRRKGVPYVRVGNSMCGLPLDARLPAKPPSIVERHTYTIDLTKSEPEILRGMSGAEKRIKKAQKEQVSVREIVDVADLDVYYDLTVATYERAKKIMMLLPRTFFTHVLERMRPLGRARYYLAEWQGTVIAGALFVQTKDTVLYYHGASGRDPAHTQKEGPAAILWQAVRDARQGGATTFDLGGCTPTDDTSDPRYGVYRYKKQWGGADSTFVNLEVVNARWMVDFQEKVIAPLWGAYTSRASRAR